ncbi:MAG: hypothetical protein R3Y53_00005 [Bacillota bacterium]
MLRADDHRSPLLGMPMCGVFPWSSDCVIFKSIVLLRAGDHRSPLLRMPSIGGKVLNFQ